MEHQITLEPYKNKSSRHTCPNCNHKHCFSKYIFAETGEYVNDLVGRCDREINCGYHFKPKQYFTENNILFEPTLSTPSTPQKKVKLIPSETSFDILKESLTNYSINNFILFITKLLGLEEANRIITRYFIGTSDHWTGSTVFWQIDTKGRVKGGKIMLYHPETGKRVKQPFNHITWVHSTLKNENYNLQQCLFGEHLLKSDPYKPVALVESEKTAIIASAYMPEFIWLATGGLSNLTLEKCKVLAGRNVALYPDLNAYQKWNDKALDLAHLANFKISDFLETTTTEEERRQGLDLADYLMRYNYNEYQFIQDYPLTIQQAA